MESPELFAAVQVKVGLGGDDMEKESPLSKGPYNSSSHLTYPSSIPP
jgi:hypothetical protein